MAFSEKTRNELARIIPKARCCRIAELSAFYDFDGFLMGKDQDMYLDLNNSSPIAARKIVTLLKGLYQDIPTQLLVRTTRQKSHACTVRVLTARFAERVFSDMHSQSTLKGTSDVLRKKCCRRAYLRGAFIGHGSITNPEKNYHLEITADKSRVAERVLATMLALDIAARLIDRNEECVVYLKGSGQIADLLTLMGAHRALLELENVRIMKGMRNRVNRLVNCETANVDKTVQASAEQVADIQLIDRMIGLDKLSPKLEQIARLRLANPYSSLKELGELAQPPISKSGVNYRLRQLKNLSEKLSKGHDG